MTTSDLKAKLNYKQDTEILLMPPSTHEATCLLPRLLDDVAFCHGPFLFR